MHIFHVAMLAFSKLELTAQVTDDPSKLKDAMLETAKILRNECERSAPLYGEMRGALKALESSK